ncbi:unnamed protein product [Schistosoma margrebowiei]|uniref:Uncharacterized protein n=1 Tax=Schistosoma margrebowiei TaxID=48269 RepID=A0A3P7YMW5_9TREM|nr:unnamed protein product [Schistosoma margrebowiei]
MRSIERRLVDDVFNEISGRIVVGNLFGLFINCCGLFASTIN